MNFLILCYHLVVLGILGFMVVNFLLNQLAVPQLRRDTPPPENPPKVSILVPARNEEAVIERCLRSLQSQNYPNYEIILLDDQSSDRTGEIARELGFSIEGKSRIINGSPLPSGWVGKPWACHQLSQAATGDFLLFTDADTDHTPFATSAAIAEAVHSKSDLLTLWPHQETKTWSEKLIIPFLFVAAGGLVPHWLLVRAQQDEKIRRWFSPTFWKRMGAANGQFILFSRKGYQRIGGHEAVRNHMVEDVSLGRLVAGKTDEGMVLTNCDGTCVVTTRMYQSFHQLWEGFTKNAWPVFDGNLSLFCAAIGGHFLVFFGPFLFLPFANFSWMMLAFEIAMIYFVRLIFTLRHRSSWLGALMHPFGCLLATAISINSYIKSRKTGLTWKGRVYQTP